MYTIQATKQVIFWNQDNSNYPNLEYFNTINFDIQIEGINNISLEQATIATEIDDLTYFKISNAKKTYYYFVSKAVKMAGDNVNIYNLTLDLYGTYMLPWLTLNGGNKLFLLRDNKFTRNTLEYTDDVINSIPKYYNSWQFGRYQFGVKQTENIKEFINGDYSLEYTTDDIINAHRCYVFSSGEKGNYEFFPVLAQTNPVTVKGVSTLPDFDKLIFKEYFKNYDVIIHNYLIENVNNITPALSNKIAEYISSGKKIVYSVEYPPDINNSQSIYKSYNLDILPNAFRVKTEGVLPDSGTGALFHFNIYVANILYVEAPVNPLYFYRVGEYINKLISTMQVAVYEPKSGGEILNQVVYNTIDNLEALRITPELSNKFLGVFFLPHTLQLGKLWYFKKYNNINYLLLKIAAVGTLIDNFKCGEIPFITETAGYNDLLVNPYIIRYFQCKYFGVDINLPFYFNDIGEVWLGGLLIFSNGATLINRIDLLSVSDAIISYGYQIPMGINEYQNYVNASINTINTSYNIQKQQSFINNTAALFDGGMSITGTLMNKKANNTTGIIGAVAGTIGKISQNKVALKNWKDTAISQYADRKNTTGNSINMGNILDASNLLNYNGNTQFTGFEFCSLTNETVAQINNVLYLYGYLNSNYRTINDFVNEGISLKNNAFIQAETSYLNMGIELDFSGLNQWEITVIKGMLIEGIRIWAQNPK